LLSGTVPNVFAGRMSSWRFTRLNGYLLHSSFPPFPITVQTIWRQFANRIRLLLEVMENPKIWKDHLPLAVRISATDWVKMDGQSRNQWNWLAVHPVVWTWWIVPRAVISKGTRSRGGPVPGSIQRSHPI
jgi:hypothetical protein